MMRVILFLVLSAFSLSTLAAQTLRPDGMGGWIIQDANTGSAWSYEQSGPVMAEREYLRQQLQLQQIRNQQLQNEILRRKLEQEKQSTQSAPQPPQVNQPLDPEFNRWQSENPWFGSDRARTEFAILYGKQLRQERPDLTGAPFLAAVSAKVKEIFAESK
jgi:hypothetical protein